MEGDLGAKGADSGEERHDVTMVLKCILVSQFPAVCILRLFFQVLESLSPQR